MGRYVLTRLGLAVPTFIALTVLTFALVRLIPGDPVEVLMGEVGVDARRRAELRTHLGLDRPLPVQYGRYVLDLARGNLGRSIATQTPVFTEFLTLFPATAELAVGAILLALALGVPAGVIAATQRGSVVDQGLMAGAVTGFSMPIFWWALLLILLFSGKLGWTPVSGRLSPLVFVEPVTGFMLVDTLLSPEKGAFTSAVRHLVLPAVVLATLPMAVIARITRSSMLEVLNEDYVRTARAKGLSPFRVVALHAFKNALIPVVTVVGLQVGVLMTGAILTETIFSWPGVGKWLVEAVYRRDYPVVQSGVLLIATLVIAANLTVDLLYGLIDPRIRHAR
ncbi:MAG TPA: ABC transporter permease subunit [Methylomirabilota bacterium]|jgi:dipeptide transport system permease protein|nr:ABC transporter permease subunit [Methylomirabilota bacterium]